MSHEYNRTKNYNNNYGKINEFFIANLDTKVLLHIRAEE